MIKNTTKYKKVYLVVYAPDEPSKFKIHPIEFHTLSWKHPMIKKTGAIFADEEYAKQFYNFIVQNVKKQDEERAKLEGTDSSEHRDDE